MDILGVYYIYSIYFLGHFKNFIYSICCIRASSDSSAIDMFIFKVKVKSLSRVRLFATPWTIAYQAPLSMGFSRQECWSGLPFLSPGDLPNPGIKPGSPALQADTLPSEPPLLPKYIAKTMYIILTKIAM